MGRASVVGSALGLIVISILITGHGRFSRPARALEIEVRASAGTFAQLFWADDLTFTEERSIRLPLGATPDAFQRLRFPLPRKGVRWLRFNPTDAPGEVLIGRMQLLDSDGRLVDTVRSESLWPAIQTAATRHGDTMRLVTTPRDSRPSLVLSLGCQDPGSWWSSPSMVTMTGPVLATSIVVALLTACVVIVGRAAFASIQNAMPQAGSMMSQGLVVLWMAALFLVVFAAKLLLMRQYPVRAPYLDQWDGECA
jgi:hypothetical protein